MVQTSLEFGQRRLAEDTLGEIKALAERSKQPNLLIASMFFEAVLAIWDGRLEEVLTIRRRMLALGEELGILEFAAIWSFWLLRARVYLGNAARALNINLQGARSQPLNISSEIAILFSLTHLGQYSEVVEMLERLVVTRPNINTAEDETPFWLDSIYLEAAVMAEDRPAAELLLHRLAGSRILTMAFGSRLVWVATWVVRRPCWEDMMKPVTTTRKPSGFVPR